METRGVGNHKESAPHHPTTNESNSERSDDSCQSSNDHNCSVAVGLPTRRFGETDKCEEDSFRSPASEMGLAKERPLWREIPEQVCDVSRTAKDVGHVLGDSASIEENRSGPDSAFYSAGGHDLPSQRRDRTERNRNSEWACPGNRCSEKCPEIRRHNGEASRRENSTPSVSNVMEEYPVKEAEFTSIEEDNHPVWPTESVWINDLGLESPYLSAEEWTHLLESDHSAPVAAVIYYGNECGVVMNGRVIRPSRRCCHNLLAPITHNRINIRKLWFLPLLPNPDEVNWLLWLTGKKIENHYIQTRGTMTVSRSLGPDIEYMKQVKIIVPTESARCWMPAFKVPKKDRARLIIDCRELNAALPPPPKMGIESLHTVLDQLRSCKFFSQYDGRSYFYQFALDEAAQEFFGLRLGNIRGDFKKFKMTVMPMGYAYAPGIAQAVSNVILRNIRAAFPEVIAHCWIDNFLFGGNDENYLSRAIEYFKEICQIIELELKDDLVPITTSMEALGIILTDVGSITLKESAKEDLTHPKAVSTIRDLFGLIGKMVWANYAVKRTSLLQLGNLLQLASDMAAKASSSSWDSPHGVPQEEWLRLTVASAQLATSEWVPRQQAFKNLWWVDASQKGLGWVEDHVGCTGVHHAPLNAIHINWKELIAIWVAIKHAKAPITIVTDSRTAYSAMSKGHTHSRAGNTLMRRIVADTKHPVQIAWVPSESQKADSVSRAIHPERATIQPQPCVLQPQTVWWSVGEEKRGG